MSKKQATLPGMEDRKMEIVEGLAEQYVQIRDQRMSYTRQEVDLKNRIMAEMKKHKKKSYSRDGIEIEIVTTSERVKVRVKTNEPPEVDDAENDE